MVLLYPDNRGAEYELHVGTTFGLWGGGGAVMPFHDTEGNIVTLHKRKR